MRGNCEEMHEQNEDDGTVEPASEKDKSSKSEDVRPPSGVDADVKKRRSRKTKFK